MRRALLWLAAAGLPLAAAAGFALRLPGWNGPAEWRWPYRTGGLGGAALVVAVVLAAVVVLLGGRERFASRRGVLAGALVGGALTLALVAAEPGGGERVARALASPQVFGYVFDAGLAPPSPQFLAGAPRSGDGLSMHARTHPPGPILAVRALDAVVRALPLPADGPAYAAAAAALASETRRARDHGRPVPAAPPSPWTVAVLGWLLPLLGAGTAVPLAAWMRDRGFAAGEVACAVALWLLAPARSVFTPSLDQALPLLLVTAAVWAPRGRAGSLAAGVLGAALVGMSYGYLPCLALLAFESFAGIGAAPADTRERFRRGLALGAGFLVPVAGGALATRFDVVAAARDALAQHHAMAVATRSYGLWLWANPWDFALLLGPGVAALAVVAVVARRLPPPARRSALALGTLFLLLWSSGSVRGEVGRIWLFGMPFACALAPAALAGEAPRRVTLAAQGLLLFALAASAVFVG